MKKFILSVTAIAGLAASVVLAQGTAPATVKKNTADLPVKVGLVDMARVFKDYTKFTELRDELQLEMGGIQEEAKVLKVQLNKLAEQAKQLNKDSPEYRAIEEKTTKMASEFETSAKLKQRDLARREAEIFETVYLEAADAVKLYAEHFKFTIVLRFNSESIDAQNPQKLANGLNKLVVYNRPEDDITEPVIEYMNRIRKPKKTPAAAATPERISSPPAKPGTSRN